MAGQATANKNTNILRILAFGDSLTEGFTDFGLTFHPYSRSLQFRLCSLLPHHPIAIHTHGKSGDRVLDSLQGTFLSRLRALCPGPEDPKYNLVIILGGTNDLAFKGRLDDGPEQIFEGLKACYEVVRGSFGASLLCLTIPERAVDGQSPRSRASREKLNSLIADYVASCQDEVAGGPSVLLMDLAKMAPFDAEGASGGGDGALWSFDGLHMTADGYDFVGEELASFVWDNLESIVPPGLKTDK
jgi:lysophospholipase L1-like esterase